MRSEISLAREVNVRLRPDGAEMAVYHNGSWSEIK